MESTSVRGMSAKRDGEDGSGGKWRARGSEGKREDKRRGRERREVENTRVRGMSAKRDGEDGSGGKCRARGSEG